MADEQQEPEEEAPEFDPATSTPECVLTIFAHPDDAEFSCGATLAKWAAQGANITMCIVTAGNKGGVDQTLTPLQLADIREQEQQAAGAILGVSDYVFMRREDGVVTPDIDLRRDITRVIRQVRPDVIVTGDPSVYWMTNEYINHPDHRAVAEAAFGALFPSAGNRHYFPELIDEGLEPHKVHHIYVSATNDGDVWIDVTQSINIKIDALRKHKSQMGDWDPEERIKAWSTETGQRHNPTMEYAESFKFFRIGG